MAHDKKNKKQKTVKNSNYNIFSTLPAQGYLVFLFCFLPLIYHNNYIDIQTFKYEVFRVATLVFIIITLAILAAEKILLVGGRHPKSQRNITDHLPFLFLLLFAVAIIISTLVSQWQSQAWTGEKGRLMGAEGLLLCTGAALALTYKGRIGKYLAYPFVIANTLVTIIGILNFWGVDVLKMYANLNPVQHSFFIGTVGNINVTSNYMCLIVPAALGLFYFTRKKAEKIALSVFAILAVYYGFAASSDSFLLGCAGTVLVLLWFSLTDHREMTELFYCCYLIYIGAWLIRLSLLIGKAAGHDSPLFSNYPTSGPIAAALSIKVLVITGIVLTLLFLGERFILSKKSDAAYRRIRKCLFIIIAVLSAVTIILICLVNIKSASFSDGALSRLIIPESFGSNRGYIWRRSAELFANQPFANKIVGCGPGTFSFAADAAFGQEMRLRFGDPFIDAHCELLQFLVTTGILGAAGYFGAQISGIWASLKKSSSVPYFIIPGAMAMSFLLQGAVNNPTVFATPQLFAVLGLIGSKKAFGDVRKQL